MNSEFRSFVAEHIAFLQQKFGYALAQMPKGQTEADKAFMDGACFAYNDVLVMLQSQLEESGYRSEFGQIALEADEAKLAKAEPEAEPKAELEAELEAEPEPESGS